MLVDGETIGKYSVRRQLGKGGMGMVYLAWDETLSREVAIKVMNPKIQGVVNALQRFKAEAQAVAKLSSEHVVHIYDFHPDAPRPYIVMEYVRGEALIDLIETQAPLSLETVADCGRQALLGLVAAHRASVIHRDVKPANILRSDEGVVKLMDFGLARSLDVESGLTASGAVVGTVHYLAPEVARGEPATAQSDLYSLGASLYEMLSGDVPFNDENPLKVISRIARETPPPIRVFREDLPPAFAAWLHKLMAVDCAARYPSADAALKDLERISSSQLRAHVDEESNERSTMELPAAQQARRAVADDPRPAPVAIDREEADAVLAEAMRIEKEGRNALKADSLMEIAHAVGVGEDAVRQALSVRREQLLRVDRRNRILRVAVPAVVGLLLLGGALAMWFQPPTPVARQYRTNAGGGEIAPPTVPVARAETQHVGANWKDSGVELDATRNVLLLHVFESGPVQCRVGDGTPFEVAQTYYGTPGGEGRVHLRTVGAPARAAAATLQSLRMAVIPFSAASGSDPATNFADGVGTTLNTRLAQRGCFEMIQRVNIEEEVLANLDLENTAYFDPKTANEIGHVLGVDYLLGGSVQQSGGRFRITAERREAATGRVLDSVVLDSTDPFTLQDRVAAELTARIIETERKRFLHPD